MVYDALASDLDGTLVGITPTGIVYLVGSTLDRLKKGASVQDILNFWFEEDREDIIQNDFEVEPEKFWEVYQKVNTVDARRPFVSVYEDIGTIRRLNEAGIKLGILLELQNILLNLK